MTLAAVYVVLALAPPNPTGPAEPWREHEAACQALADAAPTAEVGAAVAYAAAADELEMFDGALEGRDHVVAAAATALELPRYSL